jgi:hypothetical protein
MLVDIIECADSDILLVVPEGSPTAKLLSKARAARHNRRKSALQRRPKHWASCVLDSVKPQTA